MIGTIKIVLLPIYQLLKKKKKTKGRNLMIKAVENQNEFSVKRKQVTKSFIYSLLII